MEPTLTWLDLTGDEPDAVGANWMCAFRERTRTVAPAAHREWDVDAAYTELGNLRDAMIGAGLRDTSRRLETRWEQAKSLADVIDAARHIAEKSNFLHFERMRSQWHAKGFVDAPECGDGQR